MRIFFDTNVLASALATRGLCADLFRLVVSEHELLTGEFNLAELRRVLRERFRVPPAVVKEAELALRQNTIMPVPKRTLALKVRDPDDAWVLASAVAGGADALVSWRQGFAFDRQTRPPQNPGPAPALGTAQAAYLAAESLRHGKAAAGAEGFTGDLQAGRQLAALVFGDADQAQDLLDHGRLEAGGDQGLGVEALFHVRGQDGIEHVVGRKAVLIDLARAQLRRRWLGQGRLGNERPARR